METTEVVHEAIGEMLTRFDAIASKLDVAVTEVWKFSVRAHVVNAWRDIGQSVVMALLCLPCWIWTGHVAHNPLPHNIEMMPQSYYGLQCGSPTKNGAQICTNQEIQGAPIVDDKGVSGVGQLMLGSAVLGFIFGFVFLVSGLHYIIEAISCIHTAEYDTLNDLIDELR